MLKIENDRHGTLFTIANDTYGEIEVFWNTKKNVLFLRQQFPNQHNVDLISLELGEVYDLIKALSMAVESL
jgi:hypothetical protein